jgi:hypothetical protein
MVLVGGYLVSNVLPHPIVARVRNGREAAVADLGTNVSLSKIEKSGHTLATVFHVFRIVSIFIKYTRGFSTDIKLLHQVLLLIHKIFPGKTRMLKTH